MFHIFFTSIYKTGNGINQTGNGIIFPLPGLSSKIFFYKMFHIFERSLKSIYITGKKIVWTWNQIISLTSWPRIKNFFHKIFHFHQGVQTRKSNYFSHFLASDQKTSSTAYAPYLPRNSILIVKTGNGIIQTGNGIISPTSRPQIRKNFFYKIFSIITMEFKIVFQNRIWNSGNGIILPTSGPLIPQPPPRHHIKNLDWIILVEILSQFWNMV